MRTTFVKPPSFALETWRGVPGFGLAFAALLLLLSSAGVGMAITGGDTMDGDCWADSAIPGLNDHFASTHASPFGDDSRQRINDSSNHSSSMRRSVRQGSSRRQTIT